MTSHGHYPINPPLGFPTGYGKWVGDTPALEDALWQPFQGGAYWSGFLGTPGVEFKVELALGSADGQGGSTYDNPASVYDEGTYSTDDIYWVDLTPRVIEVQGTRGRARLSESFRAGTGMLTLDNQDGIFNPQRGIELVGDQAMRPGRWVRLSGKLTTENDDQWEPLWVMRVQALADEYIDAAHRILSKWALSGLETILEGRKPPPLETPDPATAGQTADERARYIWQTILDAPDQLLVTPDTYDHTLQETRFPGSAYDWMKDAAEAEGGDFYVGKQGIWYMRGRGWIDLDGLPKFNVGAYDTTEVVVLGAKTNWDMTRIRNQVTLEREGGVAQTNIDSASQALYGTSSYNRSGLANDNDADVVTLVDRQLELFAYDSMRIDQLDVWAPRLAGIRPLLELELGDLIQVEIVTAAGWSYAIKALINEVGHNVTDTDWKVTLRLDNTFRANPQLGGPFSTAYSDAYKRVSV